MKITKLSWLLLLLLCFNVNAKVYKWVDETGKVHYSDKPPIDQTQTQEIKNTWRGKEKPYSSNNQEMLADNRSDSLSVMLDLRKLLSQAKFHQLEQQLAAYQQRALLDITTESDLPTAFNSFDIAANNFQTKFDQWVNQFPDSANSYTARGSYYHHLGWRARGGKARKDTNATETITLKKRNGTYPEMRTIKPLNF